MTSAFGFSMPEREGDDLFQRVVDLAPIPMVITDTKPGILRVNQAFSEATGYSAEEMLGRDPRSLASGEHSDDFFGEMWDSLLRGGRWEGEIRNRRKNGEVHPEWFAISAVSDDRGRVTHYVGMYLDVRGRIGNDNVAQLPSHVDRLTGLPDRTLFVDRLEQAIRRARRLENQVAIIALAVEAVAGTVAGATQGAANPQPPASSAGSGAAVTPSGEELDRLLKIAAGRLQRGVRDMDTVARLGEREFAVLISDVTSAEQVVNLAGRLLASLGRPVDSVESGFSIGSSVGISVWPDHGDDPASILEKADEALAQSRRSGGGRLKLVK